MLLRESIELNIREYMGLAETLVSIPQSERGGEIAQRGFDYQTCWAGNDSNLLIVFYVQIMPDDFVMQLHRF